MLGSPWSDCPTIRDLFWCLDEQGSNPTFFQMTNARSPSALCHRDGPSSVGRPEPPGGLGSLPGPAHSMLGTPLVTTTDGQTIPGWKSPTDTSREKYRL